MATRFSPGSSESELPSGYGVSLPARLSRRGCVEVEAASLRSRIYVDTERIVIFPGDVQASWKSHDVGSAIGLALFSCFFVPVGIPCISDSPAFSIKR